MKSPDPDMPAFLRRWPTNEKREAEIAASWKARAEALRSDQVGMDIDLEKGNRMTSLVRVWPVGIPRLGEGPLEVKLLAAGEKWARFDSGPPNGTSTVPRAMWDEWKKEVLVTNLDTAGDAGTAPAVPARAPRTRKAAAEAPAEPKGREKKAAAAPAPARAAKGKAPAPKAEGGPSKKDVLWAALKAAGASGVSYAAACKAVYGDADVPAISGVIGGCAFQAENQGLILAKDGRGKEAIFVLRKKRKGE